MLCNIICLYNIEINAGRLTIAILYYTGSSNNVL